MIMAVCVRVCVYKGIGGGDAKLARGGVTILQGKIIN